jgi:hypothetical protein
MKSTYAKRKGTQRAAITALLAAGWSNPEIEKAAIIEDDRMPLILPKIQRDERSVPLQAMTEAST